jgi:hypothetical protein
MACKEILNRELEATEDVTVPVATKVDSGGGAATTKQILYSAQEDKEAIEATETRLERARAKRKQTEEPKQQDPNEHPWFPGSDPQWWARTTAKFHRDTANKWEREFEKCDDGKWQTFLADTGKSYCAVKRAKVTPLTADLLRLVRGPPWQRRRCCHETTYTHGDIVNTVRGALPGDGWSVIPPSNSGSDGFRPCNYPEAPLPHAARALGIFLGADRALNLRCADMITGNCETVASALGARLLAEFHRHDRNDNPVETLNSAYATLEMELLTEDTLTNHIDILFAPAKAAIIAAERSHSSEPATSLWANCGSSAPAPLRWKPFLWADAPTSTSFVNYHCLGVGSGLKEGLENCDCRLQPFILPVYVLAYIWDGCELTDEDLLCGDHETAVYSLHCIALVVDPVKKEAYIADPNGSLIPGGNIEFLRLPLRPLGLHHCPTTSLSQYDREQSNTQQRPAASSYGAKDK